MLDRLLTVYLYRQPPMFDAELTMTALNIVQWAVVLYLGVGFWMMSNKQIFSNLVIAKEYSKEVLKTGHDIANIQFDQSLPLLIFLFIVACILLIVFVQYIIESYFITSS